MRVGKLKELKCRIGTVVDHDKIIVEAGNH